MSLEKYLKQIVLPRADSHKGQNGRVLVIGGSKLFHAASYWSASMASKVVDLVHFSSPAMENNELMRVRAKNQFWDGIVVPWEQVEHYIEEDDAVLIGPGMPRMDGLMEGEVRTDKIVNELLHKYPDKKWVIDGGALQEVDVSLLKNQMILTPNARELGIISGRVNVSLDQLTNLPKLAMELGGVTILAKGQKDIVTYGDATVEIEGGNAGMTKGGTGDVLAGLVVALYARSPALASCAVASAVTKKAGEYAGEYAGPFFSAGDLIPEVQNVLKDMVLK